MNLLINNAPPPHSLHYLRNVQGVSLGNNIISNRSLFNNYINMKYKLNKSDKKSWNGTTLFQVEATISFGSVIKGELGGYIEKESNLDVYGNAEDVVTAG